MKEKFFALSVIYSLLIAGPACAHNQTGVQNNSMPGTTGSGVSNNPNIQNNSMPGTTGAGVNNNPNIQNNSMPGTTGSGVNNNPNIQNNSMPGTTGTATLPTVPLNMRSQQFRTFVLGRWDTNGDGAVSQSEWNAISPSWFGKNPPTFNSLDTNHNGVLDPVELQTAIPQLFQLYDTNHDGIIDSTEAAKIPSQ